MKASIFFLLLLVVITGRTNAKAVSQPEAGATAQSDKSGTNRAGGNPKPVPARLGKPQTADEENFNDSSFQAQTFPQLQNQLLGGGFGGLNSLGGFQQFPGGLSGSLNPGLGLQYYQTIGRDGQVTYIPYTTGFGTSGLGTGISTTGLGTGLGTTLNPGFGLGTGFNTGFGTTLGSGLGTQFGTGQFGFGGIGRPGFGFGNNQFGLGQTGLGFGQTGLDSFGQTGLGGFGQTGLGGFGQTGLGGFGQTGLGGFGQTGLGGFGQTGLGGFGQTGLGGFGQTGLGGFGQTGLGGLSQAGLGGLGQAGLGGLGQAGLGGLGQAGFGGLGQTGFSGLGQVGLNSFGQNELGLAQPGLIGGQFGNALNSGFGLDDRFGNRFGSTRLDDRFSGLDTRFSNRINRDRENERFDPGYSSSVIGNIRPLDNDRRQTSNVKRLESSN